MNIPTKFFAIKYIDSNTIDAIFSGFPEPVKILSLDIDNEYIPKKIISRLHIPEIIKMKSVVEILIKFALKV